MLGKGRKATDEAERLPFPESFLDVVLELLETKKLVGSRHGQGGLAGVTALERPNGKKARHAPAQRRKINKT